MNRRLKCIGWMLILVSFVIVLDACGAAPGTAPATGQPTEAPVATQQPVNPTDSAVPEPGSYEPTLVDFGDVITPEIIHGLQVFSGSGKVTNANGDILSVTATGSSEQAVRDYFSQARIYFEIREKVEVPFISPVFIQPFYPTIQDLLADDKAERLRVHVTLPEEMDVKYPAGTVLVIIDPTILVNQAHIYTFEDPTISSAEATIECGEGQIEGAMYLQGSLVGDQSQALAASEAAYLGGTGNGRYDLIVRGVSEKATYRLMGTWQRGYHQISGNPQDWLPPVELIPSSLILVDSSPEVTNSNVASGYSDPVTHEARLDNWGRLVGYGHEYKNYDICTVNSGVEWIYVETILMEHQEGAVQYMNWLVEEDKMDEHLRSLEALEGPGDAAYASWYDDTDTCPTPNNAYSVSLLFRRYNVIGIVDVQAVAGTVAEVELMDIALKLAYEIDTSLKTAVEQP